MKKLQTAAELIRSQFVDGEFEEIMDVLGTSIEPSIIDAMNRFAIIHLQEAIDLVRGNMYSGDPTESSIEDITEYINNLK